MYNNTHRHRRGWRNPFISRRSPCSGHPLRAAGSIDCLSLPAERTRINCLDFHFLSHRSAPVEPAASSTWVEIEVRIRAFVKESHSSSGPVRPPGLPHRMRHQQMVDVRTGPCPAPTGRAVDAPRRRLRHPPQGGKSGLLGVRRSRYGGGTHKSHGLGQVPLAPAQNSLG